MPEGCMPRTSGVSAGDRATIGAVRCVMHGMSMGAAGDDARILKYENRRCFANGAEGMRGISAVSPICFRSAC